jgi:hypothetical protein
LILRAFIAKLLNENADFRGIARLDGPDEEMGIYCIFEIDHATIFSRIWILTQVGGLLMGSADCCMLPAA